MTLRLTPALCILALAACSTPEPQNASYAPAPASVAHLPPPAMPGQMNAHAYPAVPEQPGALHPAPAPQGQPSTDGPGQFAEAPPFQHTPTCSTVDGVTLCDAAVDPNEPDTLHTN